MLHFTGQMVSDVLEVVSKYGGDVMSSRATLLGRDLSMMLVVKCQLGAEELLKEDLSALDQVKVCIHKATAPDVVYSVPHRHRIKVVRITGMTTQHNHTLTKPQQQQATTPAGLCCISVSTSPRKVSGSSTSPPKWRLHHSQMIRCSSFVVFSTFLFRYDK